MDFFKSLFKSVGYPHTVSNKLFEKGLSPDALRAFGRSDFMMLCKSLQTYDYSEEAASELIFKMFKGDKTAFDEMYEHSTAAGIVALQNARRFFDIDDKLAK